MFATISHSDGLKDLGREVLSQALQEKPILSLHWYSYGVLLQKQTEHGIAEYAVSPEDVAAALSNNVVFDSGILGCHTLCVRSEGARRTVTEYRPRQKTPLWLEGRADALHIPLPGLILIRTTTANRSPDYQVYAVEARPDSYNAPLYHAPLPNIYSHGGVCWGTVKKVNPAQLAGNDLAADWDQLLASPFGDHLVNGKCCSHGDDVRKLYTDLEQRRARVYPKRELVPAKKTLGKALEGMS
jgi:PRTRC genetic system protein B